MHRIVIIIIALAPMAQGVSIHLPSGATIEDLTAPSGEPLEISSDGDIVIVGEVRTRALDSPGARGPDITFNVGGTLVLLPGGKIQAAPGVPGLSETAVDIARGGDGGLGGSVWIDAEALVGHGSVVSGSGGRGGDAFARGAPDAVAVGGLGGAAGTIGLPAWVRGVVLQYGDGGDGGEAVAQGRDATCDGDDGRTARSQGTDGTVTSPQGTHAEARGNQGACGDWNTKAGQGGGAEARGGHGGPAPDARGGRGGNANATAGTGGNGRDACFDSTEEAEELLANGIMHAGHGGEGGWVIAVGGNGGLGVFGGRGGWATATSRGGNGGNATIPLNGGDGGSWDRDHSEDPRGGEGGMGLIDGGSGGGSSSTAIGGNGGSSCGALPYHGIALPGLGVPMLIVAVLLANLGGRAVGKSRKTWRWR